MIAFLFMALAALESPQTMTYAAGYIPNVQFAPFYVAQVRGYYQEEGIDLKMDYTIGPDVFKLAALGKNQIASADSDAFLHAAARGLPLIHVATLYQAYPIALIAREPILNATDLKGKRIGISGIYGSSYLGLKAILAQIGLSLEDIQLISIGFTQVAALGQGKVDAVVGYANNEPLRLRQLGFTPQVLTLDQNNGLPGVGLMTSRKFLASHPQKVAGFLRATFRGLHDVIADPEACFELVVNRYLPELKGSDNYQQELLVLKASLELWQTKEGPFGQAPTKAWENLLQLMQREFPRRSLEKWPSWLNREFTWTPPLP